MTDDESFTDLVARAPFTMNDLSLMHERARLLLGKAQRPRSAGGQGDGTLSEFDRAPRVWSPDVPWPGDDLGADGHVRFAHRTADLPGGQARGYDGSPDAGLVFELCLRNLAERAGEP